MAEQMLMKQGLGVTAINRIARALAELDKGFDEEGFTRAALANLDALELKQRVDHIIGVLRQYLPAEFLGAAQLLQKVPEVWDFGDPDDALSGFAAWPLIDSVAVTGIDEPELALETLKVLTHLFSAEFAIRDFLIVHQAATLVTLAVWVEHESEHVRRLVSEGTRPRLPWGKQLKAFVRDPRPILPLLARLKYDESLYVRRSVANNLNDIAKDHAALVVDTCKSWQSEARNQTKSRREALEWIVRHAARTLIKQGHPDAFPLLGYSPSPKVRIKNLALQNDSIAIGGDLAFVLEIESCAPKQAFVVDYAIHFLKANGTHSAKVFKLKNCELKYASSLQLEKRHSFKLITTRRYYPGTHFLAIHVNGVEQARAEFLLSA